MKDAQRKSMIKLTLFFITLSLFISGCVNKHGVSVKYYSDCKEYYDLQGYYHKECGDDDVVTYKEAGKFIDESIKSMTSEEKPKGNVY
jgi:hypothetical protein